MSKDDFIDYYQLLGINFAATDAAIDRAYRAKIKELHPDRNGGTSDAVEDTKRLNEARSVLKDPVRREEYRKLWFAQVMVRLRNKRREAPRPTSTEPQRPERQQSWRDPQPPVAWTPPPVAWTPPSPPPIVHNVAPTGGGHWGGLAGLATLLITGAYLLSNDYDRRAGRYRGRNGTFRSGPFS